MSDLSLWQIDNDLASMMEIRAEMLRSDPPEDTTEVDAQIATYITQKLPQKVDGISGILRKWKAEAGIAKDEARRLSGIAASIEARADRLKGVCMQVMPNCAGAKVSESGSISLVGQMSTLRMQRNGGLQELEIHNENLIPDEFLVVVAKFHKTDFRAWAVDGKELNAAISWECQIDSDAIRDELAMPCARCDGDGKFLTGVTENPVGIRTSDCEACDGTGKRIVPGARLAERGSHLRVVDR